MLLKCPDIYGVNSEFNSCCYGCFMYDSIEAIPEINVNNQDITEENFQLGRKCLIFGSRPDLTGK